MDDLVTNGFVDAVMKFRHRAVTFFRAAPRLLFLSLAWAGVAAPSFAAFSVPPTPRDINTLAGAGDFRAIHMRLQQIAPLMGACRGYWSGPLLYLALYAFVCLMWWMYRRYRARHRGTLRLRTRVHGTVVGASSSGGGVGELHAKRTCRLLGMRHALLGVVMGLIAFGLCLVAGYGPCLYPGSSDQLGPAPFFPFGCSPCPGSSLSRGSGGLLWPLLSFQPCPSAGCSVYVGCFSHLGNGCGTTRTSPASLCFSQGSPYMYIDMFPPRRCRPALGNLSRYYEYPPCVQRIKGLGHTSSCIIPLLPRRVPGPLRSLPGDDLCTFFSRLPSLSASPVSGPLHHHSWASPLPLHVLDNDLCLVLGLSSSPLPIHGPSSSGETTRAHRSCPLVDPPKELSVSHASWLVGPSLPAHGNRLLEEISSVSKHEWPLATNRWSELPLPDLPRETGRWLPLSYDGTRSRLSSGYSDMGRPSEYLPGGLGRHCRVVQRCGPALAPGELGTQPGCPDRVTDRGFLAVIGCPSDGGTCSHGDFRRLWCRTAGRMACFSHFAGRTVFFSCAPSSPSASGTPSDLVYSQGERLESPVVLRSSIACDSSCFSNLLPVCFKGAALCRLVCLYLCNPFWPVYRIGEAANPGPPRWHMVDGGRWVREVDEGMSADHMADSVPPAVHPDRAPLNREWRPGLWGRAQQQFGPIPHLVQPLWDAFRSQVPPAPGHISLPVSSLDDGEAMDEEPEELRAHDGHLPAQAGTPQFTPAKRFWW